MGIRRWNWYYIIAYYQFQNYILVLTLTAFITSVIHFSAVMIPIPQRPQSLPDQYNIHVTPINSNLCWSNPVSNFLHTVHIHFSSQCLCKFWGLTKIWFLRVISLKFFYYYYFLKECMWKIISICFVVGRKGLIFFSFIYLVFTLKLLKLWIY